MHAGSSLYTVLPYFLMVSHFPCSPTPSPSASDPWVLPHSRTLGKGCPHMLDSQLICDYRPLDAKSCSSALHTHAKLPLPVHKDLAKLDQLAYGENQCEGPYVVCMSVMLSPFNRIRPATA